MIDWPNSKKYVFIIIAAIVVGALYYFFLYQPPEAQYQTFNFVSGVVVGKDDAGKTITVMASEGQFIPTGIRKTFFIKDNVIIQKITREVAADSDPSKIFQSVGFNDIKAGNIVVVQGEFEPMAAKKEERVFAVSITGEDEVKFIEAEPLRPETLEVLDLPEGVTPPQ